MISKLLLIWYPVEVLNLETLSILLKIIFIDWIIFYEPTKNWFIVHFFETYLHDVNVIIKNNMTQIKQNLF